MCVYTVPKCFFKPFENSSFNQVLKKEDHVTLSGTTLWVSPDWHLWRYLLLGIKHFEMKEKGSGAFSATNYSPKLFLSKIIVQVARITECSECEGTHKDHWVQLLMAHVGTKSVTLMLLAPCSTQLSQSQGHLIDDVQTLQDRYRKA